MPCWHNYPLAEEIRKAYGLPTHVHNDANAAGLAEALWGAGAGYKCMFYATLGTGVGTAITYNAQLYLGRTGAAGEGGHMSIDYRGVRCRCGKVGMHRDVCSRLGHCCPRAGKAGARGDARKTHRRAGGREDREREE